LKNALIGEITSESLTCSRRIAIFGLQRYPNFDLTSTHRQFLFKTGIQTLTWDFFQPARIPTVYVFSAIPTNEVESTPLKLAISNKQVLPEVKFSVTPKPFPSVC